jgi:8-oxo-dGTP pyrophosphatase MutT (NUDIX family)
MTAAKCAHWGDHGAAGLLVVGKGKVLLQLRPQGVREPHTWSIPGGARGKDETAEHAALREAREETGLVAESVKIIARYRHPCACGWAYTTFVATAISMSTLCPNWETERLELVSFDDVDKLDLHPGFKAAWPALRDIIAVALDTRRPNIIAALDQRRRPIIIAAPDTRRRPNITQLTEHLWTGGDRGSTSMATYVAQLEAAGITHVIDCRPRGRADQAYVEAHAPQIDYLFNPQHDNGQKMPDWWFVDGVDFALHAMRDPAAKVLAHCQLGINRGPSMAFAILLATGMTPEEARSTIVGMRPIARIAYADDATKWWAELTAPEIFYHGGTPGLHVGDMLLPPTVTGVRPKMDGQLDALKGMYGMTPERLEAARQMVHQRDNHRVFITKDLMTAAYFASLHSHGGDVYQVEPIDNIADTTHFSFMPSETTCDRARIVGVAMEGVTQEQAMLVAQEEYARRKAAKR